MPAQPSAERFVGITVMPEYFQVEGVEGVLDRLAARAGATAIATSPYVMEPAPDGQGSREPPADAGAGKVRLLDRPLWGRRELFVRTAPSFVPDRARYAGLRYQPPAPDALTAAAGGILGRALDAARARGMKVYLQVQAAIPPGYRVQFGGPVAEDRPLLPDGAAPALRVDNNASLAAAAVTDYNRAMVTDLIRAYPQIDGLRIDWPEYPPYSLDAAFFDFNPQALAVARGLGLDVERMRIEASALRSRLLGGLDGASLEGWHSLDQLFGAAGLRDLAALKAHLAERVLADFRAALDDAGGRHVALVPNAFPPPWTALSGFRPAAAARHAQGASVKLYTMHWPMILRGWAEAILAGNPHLAGDPRLPKALARIFGLSDGEPSGELADWRYPEPGEPHPVGAAAQAAKIAAARAEAGAMPVYALAHGYGPLADVEARLAIAWRASGGRLWVNRYGYLSDEKLSAIGRVTGKMP